MSSEEILIRLLKKSEKHGNAAFRKAFWGFPDKPGYEAVYKPYGSQGRGFYYVKKEGGNKMKNFDVHIGGGYSPLRITGGNLISAIENNFDRITKAHRIGNAAGYRLKEVTAEYQKGILGGTGGVVLHITATGMGLAHKPANQTPKTTEVWIYATLEDLPEKHVFELS